MSVARRPALSASHRGAARSSPKATTAHKRTEEDPQRATCVQMRPSSIPPVIPGLRPPGEEDQFEVYARVVAPPEVVKTFVTNPSDIPEDLHRLRQLVLERLEEKARPDNPETVAEERRARHQAREAADREKRAQPDYGECKKRASHTHTYTASSSKATPIQIGRRGAKAEGTLKEDPPSFHRPLNFRCAVPQRRAG